MSTLSAPPRSLARPSAGTRGRSSAEPGSRTRGVAAIASLSLLGLTLTSLLIVVIAAQRPSFLTPVSVFDRGYFPGWMAGPFRGLWPGLTDDAVRLQWLISALMAGMFVLYVFAFRHARQLRARWTIAAVVAVHAIFLLAPPLSYTDVFNYVNYGRMGVVHHLDPYATLPLLESRSDPSYALSNWHHLLSPYGPLFTLLTYALVPLGVVASFWTLKLILALASLATLWLVWRCAKLLGRDPAGAVAFAGLNPVVLVWGLGADHNDGLMVAPLVLATYLLLRAPPAPARAGVTLAAAVFVKASAAVLLPVLLLVGDRRRVLLGAAGAAALLAAASVLAFGAHAPGISAQSQFVTAISPPNLLGLALGEGGETGTLRACVEAALLATLCGCSLWVLRRPADWLAAASVAVIALIVSLSWSGPWYLSWLAPFAALCGRRGLRIAAVALGVYFLVAFMPAAPMLAERIHFRPQATPLGARHQRESEAAVR